MASAPIEQTKTCTKCGETKSLDQFRFEKRRGRHVASCKKCEHAFQKEWRKRPENARKTAEYSARWKERNREFHRQRAREYARANRERRLEYSRVFYSDPANVRKRGETTARWEKANRERRRAAANAARRADPTKRLSNIIRAKVWVGLIKGAKLNRKTFDLLGYTADELKAHLERQFLKGMSWSNYGHSGWHIDHIIPLSSFCFETPDCPDFRAAWALSNLRPLWAHDNLAKHAKVLMLL